jgi:hypothetical protein
MREEYWLEIFVERGKGRFESLFRFCLLLLLLLLLLGNVKWIENFALIYHVTRKVHLWEVGLDGGIILKLVFKKCLINLYTWLNYLNIAAGDWLMWTHLQAVRFSKGMYSALIILLTPSCPVNLRSLQALIVVSAPCLTSRCCIKRSDLKISVLNVRQLVLMNSNNRRTCCAPPSVTVTAATWRSWRLCRILRPWPATHWGDTAFILKALFVNVRHCGMIHGFKVS